MQPLSGNSQPPTTPRQWYVQVNGQAYGPFNDQILWQYMNEGRISAQSLISHAPNTGYRLVSSDPSLMSWLAQVPQAAPAAAPEPQPAPTVFMIMGEIRSGRGMEFMQNLQSLGPTQRIGTTVWLLRASATADTLRTILSQPLGADDRLFVLDSFANETAWFNLSPEMDDQIAALWDIERE